ncbi:MAG: DEAD/DEAH box helicase [Pirellulales bacterium]
MPANNLYARYTRLDAPSRHVLQLFALSDEWLSRQDLAALSSRSGWTDTHGKRLTKTAIGPIIHKLLAKQFLIQGSYSSVRANPVVQDLAVQDSIRGDWFSTLSDIVVNKASGRYYRQERPARDLRIAFYRGEVDAFRSLLRGKNRDQNIRLLDPFNRDIFDRLDPLLREMYLTDVVPRIITNPDGNREVLAAFDELIDSHTSPDSDFLAAWLDLAVARGDLESLARLDKQTGQKLNEVAGCTALLRGDFEQAEACLGAVMPGGKRKSKLAAIGHLPALLCLLLLFKKNSADALAEARSIVSSAAKARKGHYTAAMEVVGAAITFKQSPSSPTTFAAELKELCRSPLETLLAGYFSNWLLTADDTSFHVSNLVQTAGDYRASGLDWLAAEASGLAAKSKLKSAATQAKKCQETHARLGTVSLVDLIEPEPVWQRSLSAIAQLADVTPPGIEPTPESERIIWELNTRYESISLEVFQQKRKGSGWSKGRKVGRQRLYEQFNEPEFAFLTDQDRALCRALEMSTERNYYGYRETSYDYDDLRAARALIGHPRVFPEGDREVPFEIVEQPPKLIVVQEENGRISLSLDPKPPGDDEAYRLIVDGPHRVAMVFFNDRHLKLHHILGGQLKVPASAASRVVEAIQPVASLVSVHSEIGGETSGAERVDADARPHVHLLPYQDGMRAEFFVRPFGDDGPLCRPGQGGANVFADIGGQPKIARRDLAEELRRQEEAIRACPEIAARAENDTSICFPSPIEALEALIELEDLLAAERIVLHWPQGRSLKLAGRATASQFQVHIRKDRDWFAASGNLNVDPSLSLDMMKLIDLVEASPGRFVKLDDGRFLALTEQLRLRIEELAAYGDRRSNQNTLRFPRVRAAVLEDLGESVKLKSDTHWKDWVRRMRKAADVRPEVPSTLQTELRDYQHEGFQWLARLAAWGVGGCLADDMGLGKTIQALALLLHRAAGGPALVVAPTSVVFNWMNEAQRFAPTLSARVFGTGDRSAFLKNLGPRDVVFCSYGLLHSEAERLQAQTWHTVVLDEAQAIKNTATRRSQAAMGLEADFRLIMTGTPLENHLGELWNLLEFINPGLLGSLESFQDRFAVPIERDGCRETRRRLKKLIQPFILRRTKSQVLEELPPRTEVTLQVELSDEEAAFYEALRQRAVEKLADVGDGRSQHLQILAEIMRLRRACCHPRLVLEDCEIAGSKLALFSETLDELLDNHHKVLVFSQFVGHLSILRDELDRKGVSYQYLDGSTPARQRKQRVEAFQAGEGDVFLISLKAGGLGLNLTAADYVIHMDPWWNPAVEDQASDRAHRLGQQRPVTIYRFITQGTIEQRITQLHTSKRDLADSLLEGADMSGKLSAEALLKLIRE